MFSSISGTKSSLMILLAVFTMTTTLHAQSEVSLQSMLKEMVDRDSLARYPDPAYITRQFSSYDRRMVSPDDGWFTNYDRSYFVRTEENNGRKEYVLMDAEGPGAVVRFWGTWHGPTIEGRRRPFSNGTLRVYLDGNEKPAIEGPIQDLLSAGKLVGEPLSMSSPYDPGKGNTGHNLYLPIPYAKSCKITYETDSPMDPGAARGGEALYYQINYRTYDAGVKVQSFSMDQLASVKGLLDKVQGQLMKPDYDSIGGRDVAAELEGSIEPGKSISTELTGPAAIRALTVKLDAKDIEQALRSTVLEISFDGKRTVWAPVGDFFGQGWQTHAFNTWYSKATKDGLMSCYWVMPFQKSARITLHNVGDQAVKVLVGEAKTGDWKWDDRSMYFHSNWHQLSSVSTGKVRKTFDGEDAFDVNYVTLEGKGVYVGDTLTLFNGSTSWWGEGDEKIYIDGEDFPSHIGTGTEDYYGYAWCRPDYFTAPFIAQPTGRGNNYFAMTTNSRYRSLDAIPFNTSLKFDMEIWHWQPTGMDYAPTTFWYGTVKTKSNIEPQPEVAAETVARKRSDVVDVEYVDGALEGEEMRVVKRTRGRTEMQSGTYGWSGDAQVWWRGGEPGETLELRFRGTEAGEFRILANVTKANDYGIVKISVNGKEVPEQFDLFQSRGVGTQLIDLGKHEIKRGNNILTIEIVGKNDDARPEFMFGLDYIKLEAAQ